MANIVPDELAKKISSLLKNAREKVVREVNQTMVITYYEIGRLIVEEEQNGKDRVNIWAGIDKRLVRRTDE